MPTEMTVHAALPDSPPHDKVLELRVQWYSRG